MAVDYIIWLSKHLAPNSISLWWLSIALSIYLLILVTRSIRLKGLDSQSRFDADIQASIQRKVCVEELVSRWVYVIRKYDWEVRLSVGVIWDDPFSLSLPLPLPTRVFNLTLSTPPPLPFSPILALSKPTTDWGEEPRGKQSKNLRQQNAMLGKRAPGFHTGA